MKMEQNEKKTASTLAFHHPDFEFDDIAENIFLPIYEVIATDLLEENPGTPNPMAESQDETQGAASATEPAAATPDEGFL